MHEPRLNEVFLDLWVVVRERRGVVMCSREVYVGMMLLRVLSFGNHFIIVSLKMETELNGLLLKSKNSS